MKRTLILAAVATALAGQARARDCISVVGSSTVHPFATDWRSVIRHRKLDAVPVRLSIQGPTMSTREARPKP